MTSLYDFVCFPAVSGSTLLFRRTQLMEFESKDLYPREKNVVSIRQVLCDSTFFESGDSGVLLLKSVPCTFSSARVLMSLQGLNFQIKVFSRRSMKIIQIIDALVLLEEGLS